MKSKANSFISKSRLIFLCVLLSAAWCAILIRLVEIQVVNGKEYSEIARRQSTGKTRVNAERGLVFDRKGRQVAVNVISNALCAYPSGNREIRKIHKYLDKFYGRKPGSSRRLIPLESKTFRSIDRDLPDSLAIRIVNDSIPGLYIRKGTKRDYPFANVGRQLLGFTDIDGNGISGLEFSYDSVLAGKPGLIDYLRDANRNTYRIKEIPLIEPLAGNSIVLTVDWYLQEIVEEELKAAVEEYNALEGTAIFLDAHTGEILAAADYVSDGKTDVIKLRAVSNCFEPGSVFKVFTAAALLEDDLVDMDEKIYCEEGYWKCGRRRLRDDKKYDSLTFQEIFELSSNIGMGKLALRVGGEKLSDFARHFGFGQKTFVGLPGEQSGSIGRPGVWSDYNIAALAIGHSISVTPLQLATAVSAVANGGKLMRPSIIKGMINTKGKLINRTRPQLLGKIIDSDKADILRSFMAGVVERGTATPAKSDIVSIAGKTGTAEVCDLKRGGYLKNKFVASFLGYFPAENPRIAGIVVLHQPEPIHYGGYTAGPTFKNVAERYSIANSEFLRPDTRLIAGSDETDMIKIPNFVGRDMSLALRTAEKKGINLSANSAEGIVAWQYPPEGRKIPGSETVAVIVPERDAKKVTMVDVVGMKMRTAIAVLSYQGLTFKVKGSGVVKKQYPAAGAVLSGRARCRLVCGSA